jgi:hypothetical protein
MHNIDISEVGNGEYPERQVGKQVEPDGVCDEQDAYVVDAVSFNCAHALAAQ